jgi:hypothetical protein
MEKTSNNTAVFTDSEMVSRMAKDIAEMDADNLVGLVEYMYNVKAEYNDGNIEVTTTEGLTIEEVFE